MKIADILQELERLDHVGPLEGERYATCLATYEAASDQRERILDWFAGDLAPGLPSGGARVLSVGCGAGELDRELLAAGAEHAPSLSYVGLEPDARQCERFLSLVGAREDEKVRVEAHNVGFEEFGAAQTFDLVLMVHSLYYMDDPKAALEKALKLVDAGGRLAILIASNDTLNELPAAFWQRTSGGPVWFSEDLGEHLEETGICFEHTRIEATLDVTSCCEHGSDRGVRIADFLAQVATGDLPERLRGMVFEYLACRSMRDGSRRWLPHNVDAFTIGPPRGPLSLRREPEASDSG